MATISVYATLRDEIEEAQNCLRNVDDNIRKLTGRSPGEFRVGIKRLAVGNVTGDSNAIVSSQLWPNVNPDGTKPKRRLVGSAFSRLGAQTEDPGRREEEESGEDDDDEATTKPTVQSSIVTTTKETRSRKETIEGQKGDKKGMERNRRMFGMILGTLQKFQREEGKRKEQALKRAEIEKKLETAAEKEKEELRKERQELFLSRREKQAQIRRLEQKIEIAKVHEEWETKQRLIMNFIHTKAKPSIMFLPARHNVESEKRLKESQKKIEALIKAQRMKIEEELKEIDELYKKEELEEEDLDQGEATGDKENRGPTTERLSKEEGDEEHTEENKPMEVVENTPIVPEISEINLPGEDIPKETDEEEKELGAEKIGSLGDQEFEPIYD